MTGKDTDQKISDWLCGEMVALGTIHTMGDFADHLTPRIRWLAEEYARSLAATLGIEGLDAWDRTLP